jgi:molybdopterin synthase catalytic subunit
MTTLQAPRVSIQTEDFDLTQVVHALRADDHRVGAVCTFVGTVRDRNVAPTLPAARGSLDRPMPEATTLLPVPTCAGRSGAAGISPEGARFALGRPGAETLAPTLCAVDSVQSMELEHYPGMTEKAIEAMIDEAHRRFDVFAARVIHRIGLLQPADQIVLVAVTSAHRGESFRACEFLMDYLKTQAPFWKKEQTAHGAQWVDARVSDDEALAKWGIHAKNA